MRLLILVIALSCIGTVKAENIQEEINRANTERLFDALKMQNEAIRDGKSDNHGSPIHLYKLGLSMILMAPAQSNGNTDKKLQIENQGCTLIKRAAEDGLLVAGVAQFVVCYSLLEESLSNEKKEAATNLLLSTIAKTDKWKNYYPIEVYSFQVRCTKANLDNPTTIQTFNEVLADAHELAYRLTPNKKQSDIHLKQALKLNCSTLKTEQQRL